MCNTDVREAAKKAGVFLYQIAKEMGISDATMTHRLRYELTESEKKKFFDIIENLKTEKE